MKSTMPGLDGVSDSPLRIMKWSGGNGTSGLCCIFAIGAAHEIARPRRTSFVASTRFSGVMRFSVPSSSSTPQRPLLDNVTA